MTMNVGIEIEVILTGSAQVETHFDRRRWAQDRGRL